MLQLEFEIEAGIKDKIRSFTLKRKSSFKLVNLIHTNWLKDFIHNHKNDQNSLKKIFVNAHTISLHTISLLFYTNKINIHSHDKDQV